MFHINQSALASQIPVRAIQADHLRSHAVDKLRKAAEAIAHHFPNGGSVAGGDAIADRVFIADALAEIASTTASNTTRLADELLELQEALHALRNSFVRQQYHCGSRRFAVLTEVLDCLFYADEADIEVMDLLAFVVVECLGLKDLPRLFLLSRALSDVKDFTHGPVYN